MSKTIRVGLVPCDPKNIIGICNCLHAHAEHKFFPEGAHMGACEKCGCEAFTFKGFISEVGTDFEVPDEEAAADVVTNAPQSSEP